ncbi:hypothetical protein BDP81DRAFT_390132 [Colletotrichum phormii]|uniref:Heterokaryon incompatibility domain-containing protein n=1 Tax=Colletotrichum phormii TaxID=359342 RepID=A0AAJ0EL78_9PEZI|nr:uncharacterized protein BDP81DRAFT_390132 [Colletotrichum phormii]KAK1640781.1 hypothetical protein BDP81DRAFT_390132 [Colletotrichum phormii]
MSGTEVQAHPDADQKSQPFAIFWVTDLDVPKEKLLDDSVDLIDFSETVSVTALVKYRNSANEVAEATGLVDLFTKPDKPLPWKSIGVRNETSTKPDSEHRQKTIRGWVNECNAKHKACGAKLYPGEPGLAPRRFLDIGKTPRNGVKLVSSCSVKGPYITIVHGYAGPLPAPSSSTTSENLEEREKRLHWWQIPVPLQEAITIASVLGVQYVWIQDFCVTQDVEADVNWHLAQEDIIFERSYLTIALTSTEDIRLSNFGSERKNSTAGADHAVNSVAIQKAMLAPDEHGENYKMLDAVEEHMGLFKHAPAFQRLLLSRRLLYLHKSELVWDCLKQPSCECGDPVYFGKGNRPPVLQKAVWISEGYARNPEHVLDLYKAMTPSNPEERLTVVAGLFRHILRLDGAQYFAGIVADSYAELGLELLWTILPPEGPQGDQTDQQSPSIPDAYRLHTSHIPSWSWASMVVSKGSKIGKSCFHVPNQVFNSFACEETFDSPGLECDILPGATDFLLAGNYRMKARAQVLPVTVVPPKGRRPQPPHLFSCYDGEVSDPKSSVICQFLPDCARFRESVQESDGFKCYLMLLGDMGQVAINEATGEASSERTNVQDVGLVLRESPRKQGAFERVGTFAVPQSRSTFANIAVRDLMLV